MECLQLNRPESVSLTLLLHQYHITYPQMKIILETSKLHEKYYMQTHILLAMRASICVYKLECSTHTCQSKFLLNRRLLASERSERDTLRSVQLRIADIYITRNVLLSAQMGERASVVLICIITSRYNEVK